MKSGALSNIHVSGGLLSEHFIRLMREDTGSFVYAQPETFVTPSDDGEKPPKKGEYDHKVAQAWADLKERWDTYGHQLTQLEPADARRLWAKPLLEALGFDLVPLRKSVELSDQLKLKLSHRGWDLNPRYHNPPIVHVVPPSQGLDARTERGKPSPHDAVQEYLNRHDDLWALLMNGLYLRVLRDYHHTYVKGYVEFDLEAIFITRSFRDFQALYRIAHASRFTSAETGNLYLEEYFQHSQLVGEKVGAKLRENVVRAVMALGNGFLDEDLLAELRADEAKCHQFYEEILRVVYRIIFLLYAEQRGMLSGGEATHHDLYLEEYSMSALRERALTDYRALDRHVDYWIGLRSTFEILRSGSSELGIYPYGGMLFDTDRDNYVAQYACKNAELLEGVYYLTTTEIDDAIHRISYADIDVEEIGAIYESLLENTPQITSTPETINNIDYPANSFILDPRALTRKTTGSYYTSHALIQELIKSALEPIIKDRLSNVGTASEERERALLSITVCDPACGSGAFLIAACNRLAIELARIRTGDIVLTDVGLQSARRDALQHCIYGVDLNPMAIELVKVSLWINALVKDKPLSFLDHHLKQGNSVIGSTRNLMAGGIPTEAFNPVLGDHKKVADQVKSINKAQRLSTSLSGWAEEQTIHSLYGAEFAQLSNVAEITPDAVKEKNRKYAELLKNGQYSKSRFLADIWTCAFFWPLTEEEQEFPTQHILSSADRDSTSISASFEDKIDRLAQTYSWFHWELEFPEVFNGIEPGFDCILGNPPWEFVEIQEKEFFGQEAPKIAQARTAADRKKMIRELAERDPRLYDVFANAKRQTECESKFLRGSSRFPLSGKGNINTYSIFVEHATQIMRSTGRAGLVVPSGIATDARTARLFRALIDNRQLISLFDFENRRKVFPIDSRYKFCLLTLSGSDAPSHKFNIAFFLQDVTDLSNADKQIELSKDDIHLINPNTATCPILRTKRDAAIIKRIYKRVPILVAEGSSNNPWPINARQGPFNLSHDSMLFQDAKMLKRSEYQFEGISIKANETRYYPLYVGKMIWIYNHRFSSVAETDANHNAEEVEFQEVNTERLADPNFSARSRFWIQEKEVISRLSTGQGWLCGYRNIARATDARTSMFAIIPYSAIGNSLNLILFDEMRPEAKAAFVANANSLVFDYITRQKVGGAALNQFIFKQLPFLPPWVYTDELARQIAGKVLELSYTSWDLRDFAKELGYVDDEGVVRPPFIWNENRRAHLQADLDAIYAHLYGISTEDLRYVLDTFPIVKRNDEHKYGAYRTKELILSYFEDYAGKITPVEELVPHDGR